jgi:antitoxin (DNA-binding transcriptional repressor) of toxin-antitoxin stability system
MITHVTLPETTANIAQLLDRVRQGEDQAIAHISVPKSDRIQPIPPRVPGQYASQFTVPDNFNAPLPDDILETFLLPVEPLLIL